MASSNLQGLNLIHPESPPSSLTDSQDLLATPLFPDLAAQLDLWTHVNFATDEPFISVRDRKEKEAETASHSDSLTRKEAAHFTAPAPSPVAAHALPQQQFDFSRFLAEFGIPNNADGLNLQNAPGVISALAQPGFTSPSFSALPPATPAAPSAVAQPTSESTPTSVPPAKRPRTLTKSQPANPSTSSPTLTFPDPEQESATPVTAAEDKRRRNTAASARFRLKKKEREAALDAKAHALEERVTALERECEGLRRENGWLRGLVVGVTGGVVPSMTDIPIVATPAAATATTAGADNRMRGDEAA